MSTPQQISPPANGQPLSSPILVLPPGDASAIKCRRVALVCALVVVGIALLALLGRATGQLVLAGQFHSDWNPMATSTAVMFFLLGFSLWWWVRWPAHPLVRWCAASVALLVILVGVGELLQAAGYLQTSLEDFLFREPARTSRDEDPNEMSPLTAANCCLASLALLLAVWGGGWLTRRVTGGLTAVIAFFNLWVLFCYVEVKHKTLQDRIGIPVAIPTAVAWLFLGVGLVAAEGPKHFLIRPLLGSSTRALLLRSFLPATVGVVLMAGILHGSLATHLVDLALLSTLWTLIAGGIVSLLILYVANRIGGRIDRAESARAHALEEMRKAREAAEQHNRAKSQFLANMSHELRTPLTVILGYIELIQDEVRQEGHEALLPDLAEVHSQGKHLLTLINDLLDMSKIEADKVALYPETFDLAGMVRDVATVVRPLAEKNANTLEVQTPDGLGTMHTDLTRLRQCLLNLLSNACKFTEKGQIRVAVTRTAIAGEEWIVFSVKDTGIGLTEEQLQKLFEAFTQADLSTTRKYGGTGLGLVITRRLCQLMGGDITVASVPAQGSIFTIKLPAVLSLARAEGTTGRQPADGTGQAETDSNTILVVDDDPVMRELLNRVLSKEGFNVVTAARGEECLRLAEKVRPRAITLDVMMPGMDGWAVLSTLKANRQLADIPVIMLSIVDDMRLGQALGASDYLTKPLDRTRLVAALKKWCNNSSTRRVALIAEDDPATRDVLRRTLEKDGWAVVEAANGREALECVRQRPPSVIVLDLMMPEMDGFEFLNQLRQQPEGQKIPVLVVTAKDLSEEERLYLNGSMLLSCYGPHLVQKGSGPLDTIPSRLRELLAQAGSA